MRKMKPTASNCREREGDWQRRTLCSTRFTADRLKQNAHILQANSQIAKQLHISKKFDEKSSHLLLLLCCCVALCVAVVYLFHFYFYFFFVFVLFSLFLLSVALNEMPLEECGGATRKCRLNFEWSKTINSKHNEIAMPPAKPMDTNLQMCFESGRRNAAGETTTKYGNATTQTQL